MRRRREGEDRGTGRNREGTRRRRRRVCHWRDSTLRSEWRPRAAGLEGSGQRALAPLCVVCLLDDARGRRGFEGRDEESGGSAASAATRDSEGNGNRDNVCSLCRNESVSFF